MLIIMEMDRKNWIEYNELHISEWNEMSTATTADGQAKRKL